jgi:chemotaxis protein MotB
LRRRNKSERHANHERWLVSYADFITLLFAFFVVMYSTAQVDKQKVGKLALSIQVAFDQLGVFPGSAMPSAPPGMYPPPKPNISSTGNGGEDMSALEGELQKALEPEIARNEVAIRKVPDGLVISLREVGFFDSGSANLQARGSEAFGRIAELLLRYPHRIRIEGHTDNVPIHNSQFASNWELSTARATEMVQTLIDEYQFPPARLSAAGYAQYHPVAANDSADGRAQNRRVDVLVLDSQVTAPGMGADNSNTKTESVAKPNPAKLPESP